MASPPASNKCSCCRHFRSISSGVHTVGSWRSCGFTPACRERCQDARIAGRTCSSWVSSPVTNRSQAFLTSLAACRVNAVDSSPMITAPSFYAGNPYHETSFFVYSDIVGVALRRRSSGVRRRISGVERQLALKRKVQNAEAINTCHGGASCALSGIAFAVHRRKPGLRPSGIAWCRSEKRSWQRPKRARRA